MMNDFGPEPALALQICRNRVGPRAPEPRQRHMRLEIAPLRRQSCIARRAFVGPPQRLESLRRLDIGKDRARLAAAETAEAVQPELERRRDDLAESGGKVPRRVPINIADEAQRQVIILRIDPARTRYPGAEQGETLGDAGRDLDGGK